MEEENVSAIDSQIEIAYVVTEMIVFLPALLGNSLILISIYQNHHLRAPMYLLIGNLAITDLLVAILLTPLELFVTFSPYEAEDIWYFCLINHLVFALLLGTSLLTLAVMSIERFFAMALPFKHRSANMKKAIKAVIILIWVAMLIVGAMPLTGLGLKSHFKKQCLFYKLVTKEYFFTLSSIVWGSFLVSFIFFLAVVRIVYKKRHSNMPSLRTTSSVREKPSMKNTHLMLILSATNLFCWAPYSILMLVSVFYKSQTLLYVWRVGGCMGLLNSAFNWIIYGMRNKRFQQAFKNTLHLSRFPFQSSTSSSNLSTQTNRKSSS